MCLICVPNLKEIDPQEVNFSWLKFIVLNWCKEEKYEENISEMYISKTTQLQIWYVKSCIWRA